MWVRGLKHKTDVTKLYALRVAPYVGAWIETSNAWQSSNRVLSHPMWVRGLKPLLAYQKICQDCRTLCGCVD